MCGRGGDGEGAVCAPHGHGVAAGAGTDIRLDGANARIELADGTIQPVGEVVLDGKHGIRCVTYGGPDSSAKIKDSRISGTGMLWATKGLPGGFIINFR